MLRPKRKIIISVHGIRTTGGWQKQLASVVSENGWIYYPLDYGYFTALQFAFPPARKAKIVWFCNQFDQIKNRFPDVTPSVIAHSNGTYIVANALKTYPHIRVDKVILLGSIVRQDFDWKTIFERKQATLVRNEVGVKDIWAGNVQKLAWGDTGASGQRGFTANSTNAEGRTRRIKAEYIDAEGRGRLLQPDFPEFGHGSFQAFGHYRTFWLPFLDEPTPYVGETDPPWYAEEPVSPYDAARWSAMTYFHQYIARVHSAIVNKETFAEDPAQVLSAKRLWVIIPESPGAATKDSITSFFDKHGLKTGRAGKNDPRTFKYNSGETLYDLPSTINTLGFLDNRKDEELDEAVAEFQKWLERLINSSRYKWADAVEIKPIKKLPADLV